MGGSNSKTSNLDPTKLSGAFPVIIYGCESTAKPLFDCLEKKGERDESTGGTVGSVEECTDLIKKYNDCYESKIHKKANAKFRRVQERVPGEYRWQAK